MKTVFFVTLAALTLAASNRESGKLVALPLQAGHVDRGEARLAPGDPGGPDL